MRPEPIDSTNQILSPPQILVEFLRRYDDGKHPIQIAMIALADELSMDDAESIQFGNTAFISHYSQDMKTVLMRALNVDTAKNFVDNVENYVAHVYQRGVKNIATVFKDDSIASVIRAAKQRIDKNNKNLKASLKFSEHNDGQTMAVIKLEQ